MLVLFIVVFLFFDEASSLSSFVSLGRKYFVFQEQIRDFSLASHNIWKIKQIFDSHKGPEIQSFKLHINHVGVAPLIEKWVQICIEKKVLSLFLSF